MREIYQKGYIAMGPIKGVCVTFWHQKCFGFLLINVRFFDIMTLWVTHISNHHYKTEKSFT